MVHLLQKMQDIDKFIIKMQVANKFTIEKASYRYIQYKKYYKNKFTIKNASNR